ncbi:MAG: dTDP-4-dehydrorhamnose reductase [Alphaproteobacteria bacterium]|nr:MAG: dTDP-4-dehydrorhamnose reductase [Alphaproteobacteria bacterium]
MKILVTGAKGQVGAALVRQGKDRGHEMIAMDRQSLDITDREANHAAIHCDTPDLVINAAAYTAVDKAEEDEASALAINGAGAENLAHICHEIDIPFLHISTDFVFDGTKEGAYVETDPVAPLSAYGRSKAVGEEMITAIGGRHIILRTAWVFGGAQNFVSTILRLADERDELNIIDDQTGGPTPAGAIAETLLTIAEQVTEEGFDDWGLYHYCGKPSVTWYGFTKAILEGRDKPRVNPIPTEDYPTPAERPKNSVLDCSRIRDVFGIEQPDWQAALKDILKVRGK